MSSLASSSSSCDTSSSSSSSLLHPRTKTISRGPISVLYASQTGTALDSAERIAKEAEKRYFHPVHVISLGAPDIVNLLPTLGVAVFCISTSGDGDIPDHAKPLWKFLLRRDLSSTKSLSSLKIAVFGLGDSGYAKFNAAAKKFLVRMLQLGAQSLPSCTHGLGDDRSVRGVAGDLDDWLNSILWPSLEIECPIPPTLHALANGLDLSPRRQCQRFNLISVSKPEEELTTSTTSYLPNHSGVGTLLSSTRLTKTDWSQEVLHLRFSIQSPTSSSSSSSSSSTLTYQAGDFATLRPCNPVDAVKRLSVRLGISGDLSKKCVTISSIPQELNDVNDVDDNDDKEGNTETSLPPPPSPPSSWSRVIHIRDDKSTNGCSISLPTDTFLSIHDLLSWHLDICGVPRRSVFEQLSFLASSPEQAEKLLELSQSQGYDIYYEYVVQEKRTFVEVLEDFDSISITLNQLIELVPVLQPRSYSIASSPSHDVFNDNNNYDDGVVLELCVAVVSYSTKFGRQKKGVASLWLSSLVVGDKVPFLENRQGPLSKASSRAMQDGRPLILIGPGTGIAPMRSIWREVKSSKRVINTSSLTSSSSSSVFLFFGCRHKEKDWLYQEECLKEFYDKDNGVITLYEVAFSRDDHSDESSSLVLTSSSSSLTTTLSLPIAESSSSAASIASSELTSSNIARTIIKNKKDYVQHRLLRQSGQIADLLLKQGAVVLIAGSASKMPADVTAAICEVLRKETEELKGQGVAEKYLAKLESEGRFAIEAW
jgi:sulfite reductase alpha subunit-like flavoprotein